MPMTADLKTGMRMLDHESDLTPQKALAMSADRIDMSTLNAN